MTIPGDPGRRCSAGSSTSNALPGWRIERVARLAWLHDVNRWPFAHNAEKGIYDQAANIPPFFAEHGSFLRGEEIEDLVAFHRRDVDSLSEYARLTLLADFVAGLASSLHRDRDVDRFRHEFGGLFRDAVGLFDLTFTLKASFVRPVRPLVDGGGPDVERMLASMTKSSSSPAWLRAP